MINRVVLVGRLTKDPELKYTQTGVAVTRFTLAVNRTFKSSDGEQQADFINCVTWRKQAENTANYLKKGSLAGIEGRIQTSSFDGQDGKRIFMTEVVADSVQFLEPRSSSPEGGQAPRDTNTPNYQQGGQNQQQTTYNAPNNDPFSNQGGQIPVDDSDLPF